MKTIVAAVDFSNATTGVLRMAASLATAYGANLHLLHVVEPEPSYTAYGFTPDEFPALHAYQMEARRRAGEKLGTLLEDAKRNCATCVSEVVEGSPTHSIAEYVDKIGADLVVLGSHGHTAIGALLIGSVAEGFVRKAKVPTLVVPAPAE
ncbi:MAG: universal stress protein [Verrucomicrobiota bacterium]